MLNADDINVQNMKNSEKAPPPCMACANCLVTVNPITEKREYKCALIVNRYDIITGEIDYISSMVVQTGRDSNLLILKNII